MNTLDLGGPLLASVSRSFYLTIRLLPGPLRAPIGLAYLLARASDTIADSTTAPVPVRLEALAAFGAIIQSGRTEGLAAIQAGIAPENPGERELLAQLPRCLQWLASLEPTDRTEIQRVLAIIIRGQTLDLERFSEAGQIVALPAAADLEEYAYLVAGCVGEFWTRLCLRHLPRYSALEPGELARIGINFGKGLQLVNILRDMPADLRAGRCYLPADQLAAAGLSLPSLLSDPKGARPLVNAWVAKAGDYLDDGRQYIAALRSARLRAACFFPWYLGIKTLALMQAQPPLEASKKIKVPRSTVRLALAWSLPAAFSNRALLATARHGWPR